MISAENERAATITGDASKFNKVNIQRNNKKQVRDFDSSDEEKEPLVMTTGEPELPQGQATQPQIQETTQLRGSTRQRTSTRNTIYKDFTSARWIILNLNFAFVIKFSREKKMNFRLKLKI